MTSGLDLKRPLRVIGPKTHALLRNSTTPVVLAKKPFAQIVEIPKNTATFFPSTTLLAVK